MRFGVILPWSYSIRMYGRENSEVVKPTKAVRVTRNTFSGSIKNNLPKANAGPVSMICTVSSAAAPKVTRLKPTLKSAATSRCPIRARMKPPSRGVNSTSNSKSMSVLFQVFQIADIQIVELLADLEHEHTED